MHSKPTLFIFFLFVSSANKKKKENRTKRKKNMAFNTTVGAPNDGGDEPAKWSTTEYASRCSQ